MMLNWIELGTACAKGLLVILNGMCIVTAICTFGFAVVDTRLLKQYGVDHAGGSFTADVVIIFACVLLAGIATFGCVGAIKENVKILYMYVGLLTILVLLELLIAIYVSLERYGLGFRMTEFLREDFFKNLTEPVLEQHREEMWDDIQLQYECCGLNGPEDYTATERNIPLSCCPRAHRARNTRAEHTLYIACIESKSYYSEGCEDEVLDVLRSDSDWLLGVAVTSFWFEAAGMLLAMWIANNLKNAVQVYKDGLRY